jgi:ABC-type multidrug transport system fused ATPase/permease subunit
MGDIYSDSMNLQILSLIEMAKKLYPQHLSTIRGANIIHVIENGRLVESGTWGDLIVKENSRFRELCKAQGIDN